MAARNCLVEKAGQGLGRLKITDFGMARFVGEQREFKLARVQHMPVAWTALESVEHFIWTVESDVWSLGVLVWEVSGSSSLILSGNY